METHEKRGKGKEEALVLCFLCLCQPRATIMLVNRNIFIYLFFFLVRKGTSLSRVYISCRIARSLFLGRAAGLRNAHIRRAV